ncbi:DUF7738 domain-containing protein [Duganella aceris]|uniref:DUF7738 domain-containing protein n=1 Tax=Duganella aceris TaxID=2703883 RepID=A0ABX0FK36_9BURK|nr:hypothetical protein [Duganella aceris]NGZ84941.1 hypothetical protein [Duganella aceris]
MGKIYVPILLAVAIPACYGQTSAASPSMGDRFNSAFEKAAKATGVIKGYGRPSKVDKGAQPAISIYFNNHQLMLGRQMDEWKKAIGSGGVCSPKSERPMWCKWDTLGIEITATFERPQLVSQMKLHFSRDPEESLYDTRPRDAKGKPIDPVWLSKGVFPGYLELDGFGIDKHAKFWEVRAGADRQRDLQCGLQSCAHPRGLFGPDAAIYLMLSREDEYGELREFGITSSTE